MNVKVLDSHQRLYRIFMDGDNILTGTGFHPYLLYGQTTVRIRTSLFTSKSIVRMGLVPIRCLCKIQYLPSHQRYFDLFAVVLIGLSVRRCNCPVTDAIF